LQVTTLWETVRGIQRSPPTRQRDTDKRAGWNDIDWVGYPNITQIPHHVAVVRFAVDTKETHVALRQPEPSTSIGNTWFLDIATHSARESEQAIEKDSRIPLPGIYKTTQTVREMLLHTKGLTLQYANVFDRGWFCVRLWLIRHLPNLSNLVRAVARGELAARFV